MTRTTQIFIAVENQRMVSSILDCLFSPSIMRILLDFIWFCFVSSPDIFKDKKHPELWNNRKVWIPPRILINPKTKNFWFKVLSILHMADGRMNSSLLVQYRVLHYVRYNPIAFLSRTLLNVLCISFTPLFYLLLFFWRNTKRRSMCVYGMFEPLE